MLKLLGKDGASLGLLVNCKDICIESNLKTGLKSLSFSFPISDTLADSIQAETYIQTEDYEYIVKEVNKESNDWFSVYCNPNTEALTGKPHLNFTALESKAADIIRLALGSNSGWTVQEVDTITKRRTIRKETGSTLDIINDVIKVFMIEIEFDTLNKVIKIYEKRGQNKGIYFINQLNLKKLQEQSSTYDFITRLIPIGKDGLTIADINGGKDYIDNNQYSNKVVAQYWIDKRYTDVKSLKEDATSKLEELSKPIKSYSAQLINFNNNIDLGDIITLIDNIKNIKETQRIVKIKEYPLTPEKNTVEIANRTLSFTEMQAKLDEAAQIVDDVTTDSGAIDASKIEGLSDSNEELSEIKTKLDSLEANKATVGQLSAVEATIGELRANKADVTELNAAKADITDLQATKAEIKDLEAANATITNISASVGAIETLVSGNISSGNIQTGGITGDNLNMETIFVNDANIINVNASKINAGEINTNKVHIQSENGGIVIADNTQQFKDKNGKVRIQMGQDAKGNFNFGVFDEAGTGVLIDSTGVKEKALADGIIKDRMIGQAEIKGSKINISSLVTEVNKDTNTSSIKASKVLLDTQGQKLDVAFNSLKNQADSTKSQTESNTTQLNVAQGKINTLIQDTTIEKDGQSLKLKDEYSKLEQTVGSINSTVGKHTTSITTIGNTATTAQTAANKANTLADSKAKVFTSTPTTPYKVGDLWVQGSTGDLMKCKIARSTGSYTSSDWEKASKYTDDTKANAVEGSLNTLSGKVTNVENNYSSLNQNLNSFKTTVGNTYSTKSELSAVDGKVTNLTTRVGTTESNITQLNNKIALKVEASDITNAINNTNIGGDNVLRNGNFANELTNWSIHDTSSSTGSNKSVTVVTGGDWAPSDKKVLQIKGTNTTDRYGVMSSTLKLIPNTKYTISGYCAGHRVEKIQVNIRDLDSSSANIHTINITPVSGGATLNKWTRFETTFTTTSKSSFALNLYGVTFADNGYVWFCDVQIQQGTKASAWTPCSADIDTSISNVQTQVTTTNNKVASIETNLNGITQRVSSTESTISTHTTQLGTVDNRINTAKNAAISAAATDATSKANNAQSKALADAKSYTNGQITTVNKTITDKVAEIKTTTDSITQRVSSTESTTSTLTTKVNTAQSTADSKAKVFTSTPTVPYKVGDLWTGGPSGDVMRCKVARTSGNYTASDWEKASKYTDDTKANAAQSAANAAQSTANTANATANANKTEITSTKNKVSTIETNLNSITSKVSSAEKNITTINGNITSLQNRMSSAEQKITSSAIISTVQSTINTAKNEAINSANSSTDSKLQSYATKSSMELTANQLKLDFSSSGGMNLVKDGQFKSWDWNNGKWWWFDSNLAIYGRGSNGVNGTSVGFYSTNDKETRLYSNYLSFKSNTTYTFRADVFKEENVYWWGAYIEFKNANGDIIGQHDCPTYGYTFTTPEGCTNGYLIIKHGGRSSSSGGFVLWVDSVAIYEGTTLLPYSPHPDEVYDGNTIINGQGVTINNGALKVVNSNSEVVIDGHYNIHKIIATGLLDCNMPSGVQSREFYVDHNFGYIPHFAMEQQLNGDGKSVPLPAFTMEGVAPNNDTLSFNMIIRCWATTTRLYVNIMRSPVRAAKVDNIKVRYFLYKEVAF